jgi:hypothetical protein
MKNLARSVQTPSVLDGVDNEVLKELKCAGIQPYTIIRKGEVPTQYGGLLCGWTFDRAWYYWRASGRMPITSARKIYAAGNCSIRAGGHGCAPPPDEQLVYYHTDGREIVTRKDWAAMRRHGRDISSSMRNIFAPDRIAREYVCEGIEGAERRDETAFVTSYHIDTQEALDEFAAFLRSLAVRKAA